MKECSCGENVEIKLSTLLVLLFLVVSTVLQIFCFAWLWRIDKFLILSALAADIRYEQGLPPIQVPLAVPDGKRSLSQNPSKKVH